ARVGSTTLTSSPGTLTAPSSVAFRSDLVVSVTDADANRHTGVADTVNVPVIRTGCPACTAYTVSLSQAGVSTGEFNNSGTPFDYATTLGLGAGDQMTVTYNDTDPTSNVRTATVTIADTNGILSVSPTVGIAGTLIVTVQDPELNTNPNTPETI